MTEPDPGNCAGIIPDPGTDHGNLTGARFENDRSAIRSGHGTCRYVLRAPVVFNNLYKVNMHMLTHTPPHPTTMAEELFAHVKEMMK